MNLHPRERTTTSTLRVYQFRHVRMRVISCSYIGQYGISQVLNRSRRAILPPQRAPQMQEDNSNKLRNRDKFFPSPLPARSIQPMASIAFQLTYHRGENHWDPSVIKTQTGEAVRLEAQASSLNRTLETCHKYAEKLASGPQDMLDAEIIVPITLRRPENGQGLEASWFRPINQESCFLAAQEETNTPERFLPILLAQIADELEARLEKRACIRPVISGRFTYKDSLSGSFLQPKEPSLPQPAPPKTGLKDKVTQLWKKPPEPQPRQIMIDISRSDAPESVYIARMRGGLLQAENGDLSNLLIDMYVQISEMEQSPPPADDAPADEGARPPAAQPIEPIYNYVTHVTLTQSGSAWRAESRDISLSTQEDQSLDALLASIKEDMAAHWQQYGKQAIRFDELQYSIAMQMPIYRD